MGINIYNKMLRILINECHLLGYLHMASKFLDKSSICWIICLHVLCVSKKPEVFTEISDDVFY